MIKTTLATVAASGLSVFSFAFDADTAPRSDADFLNKDELHFNHIDMDALLYAPVIDDLEHRIGHVDEVMVAGNGEISGFVVSEYSFLPIFSESRVITTSDARVEKIDATTFVVRADG